jgi:hypothetical protein
MKENENKTKMKQKNPDRKRKKAKERKKINYKNKNKNKNKRAWNKVVLTRFCATEVSALCMLDQTVGGSCLQMDNNHIGPYIDQTRRSICRI